MTGPTCAAGCPTWSPGGRSSGSGSRCLGCGGRAARRFSCCWPASPGSPLTSRQPGPTAVAVGSPLTPRFFHRGARSSPWRLHCRAGRLRTRLAAARGGAGVYRRPRWPLWNGDGSAALSAPCYARRRRRFRRAPGWRSRAIAGRGLAAVALLAAAIGADAARSLAGSPQGVTDLTVLGYQVAAAAAGAVLFSAALFHAAGRARRAGRRARAWRPVTARRAPRPARRSGTRDRLRGRWRPSVYIRRRRAADNSGHCDGEAGGRRDPRSRRAGRRGHEVGGAGCGRSCGGARPPPSGGRSPGGRRRGLAAPAARGRGRGAAAPGGAARPRAWRRADGRRPARTGNEP